MAAVKLITMAELNDELAVPFSSFFLQNNIKKHLILSLIVFYIYYECNIICAVLIFAYFEVNFLPLFGMSKIMYILVLFKPVS